MAPTDPYGLLGQVLDGQYRVDRVIGEGGFSVVYRGLHVGLDEPVAIKCLKLQAQLGSSLIETFIRRFRDESKIHYRLSRGSLHIARSIAAGTTMAPATGALVPYMVLEWLEGFTLAEELRARRMRGERGRPLAEVIRMLDPVADAMAFAHAQGVVHRDLNPSNIFVAHAGGTTKLKVLDFGVAKVISDHAMALGPRAATLGHVRMFTPAYGAPEQFNDSLGKVAQYTDVYACALVVLELLMDKTPVQGEHFGELADRVLDPGRRPTPRAMGVLVGDAVENVMLRAVSVDPSHRPSDIGEFWGMLKNAMNRDAQQAKSSHVPAPAAQQGPGSTYPSNAPIPMVRGMAGVSRPVDPLASTAPPTARTPGIGPSQPPSQHAPSAARGGSYSSMTPGAYSSVAPPAANAHAATVQQAVRTDYVYGGSPAASGFAHAPPTQAAPPQNPAGYNASPGYHPTASAAPMDVGRGPPPSGYAGAQNPGGPGTGDARWTTSRPPPGEGGYAIPKAATPSTKPKASNPLLVVGLVLLVLVGGGAAFMAVKLIMH